MAGQRFFMQLRPSGMGNSYVPGNAKSIDCVNETGKNNKRTG